MDKPRISTLSAVRISFIVIVLSAVIGGVGVGAAIYLRAQNEGQFADTHDAICALSADLERRTVASRKFLREHPSGIPGIPTTTIREGIRNQERTIDALSVASC